MSDENTNIITIDTQFILDMNIKHNRHDIHNKNTHYYYIIFTYI